MHDKDNIPKMVNDEDLKKVACKPLHEKYSLHDIESTAQRGEQV